MKTLTKTLLHSALAAVALTPLLSAQSQDDLKAKYEEKLSHKFIEKGGWLTDYDKAREKAEAEGKVLFVYFSRSYSP